MEFEIENLTGGQLNAIVKKLGGEKGALRLLAGAMEIVHRVLVPHRTVKVASHPATTTSEEYFREAGIKISTYEPTFKDQFLGLDIPATEASELMVWNLYEGSTYGEVLNELKMKAEISIAEFHAFVSSLPLYLEGWHIFHLRGKDENIWTLSVSWHGHPEELHGFWYVSAEPFDGSEWLGAGHSRVVSRN